MRLARLFLAFVVLVVLASDKASAVPAITSGLVGHYAFEGSAEDSSFVENDATAFGNLQYSAGVVGLGADFDGIDDYVLIPSNSSLDFGATDFSVAYWFNTSGHGLRIDERCCDERGFGLGSYHEQSHSPPFGVVAFGTNSGSGGDTSVDLIAEMLDDEWHFLVGTRLGSTLSLYLDGNFLGSSIGPLRDIGESNPIYVAQRFGVSGPYGEGMMDEISIYDRALSASEVQTLYSAVPEPSTALLLGLGLAGMALRKKGRGF